MPYHFYFSNRLALFSSLPPYSFLSRPLSNRCSARPAFAWHERKDDIPPTDQFGTAVVLIYLCAHVILNISRQVRQVIRQTRGHLSSDEYASENAKQNQPTK